MPAVFYIAGIVFGAISGYFVYASQTAYVIVSTELEIANFQNIHASALALALGSGIISAIMFSTGAIIETMRRAERDPE